MSNDQTEKVHTVTDLPSAEGVVPEFVKPSRLTQAKAFIKHHKSHLIAGAGLVALVGVSASVGRATAPTTFVGDFHFEVEDPDVVDLEIESTDQPVPTDD